MMTRMFLDRRDFLRAGGPVGLAAAELMEDSGAYTFLTNGLSGIVVRDDIVPVIRPDGISLYLPGFRRA